jgi:membrane-bound lytic murein transglycosylase D
MLGSKNTPRPLLSVLRLFQGVAMLGFLMTVWEARETLVSAAPRPARRQSSSEADFEVKPEIQASVHFWKRVYGEWTSEQIVFFDKRHPELVYEVLDLSPLKARSRNAVVFEILSKRKIKARTAEIRSALKEWANSERGPSRKRLAGKPLSPLAVAFGRKIQALTGEHRKHSPAEFVKSLKIQSGQRDHVLAGLQRAQPYLETMERIFEEYGVPQPVTRLSLIESSFNPLATSKVGAAGVWQFMEKSSKGKLRIDPQAGIDERRSPIKATRAAAQLLRAHHKLLDDWMLTVVSYNHGLRSFLKIPKSRRTSHDLAGFFAPCNRKSPLGFASRNYYSEFLAFLEVSGDLLANEPSLRRGSLAQRDLLLPPVIFEKVSGGRSAAAVAQAHGVSLEQIRRLNPDVSRPHQPLPAGFWLALPIEGPRRASGVPALKEAAAKTQASHDG